nr:DNA replication helicase [Hemiselmis andersenii]
MKYLVEKKPCPHSVLAEQIILTDILLNTYNHDLIFNRLEPEVFYLSNHKYIYEASRHLYFQDKNINLTAVADILTEMSVLDSIGGSSFLVDLVNQIIPIGSIDTYIVLLLDKYLRRSLVDVGIRISRLGYDTSSSIEVLFDQSEQILFSLTHIKPTFGLLSSSEVLLETFVELEAKYKTGSLSGVPSGFFDLDNLTQGFQKSDLIIIAGRPSMGKTAFALNLARNISEVQQYPVSIFSLEMSRQQIIYRFLSVESQIINSRLKSGNITPEEWKLVSKAIEYLATLKIYLDDSPSNSLGDIRSKLTRLKSSQGQIGAVIIDYLQLITDGLSKNNNRVQELSRITRNLKILAREFDTPVIVLSQLSRNVETRVNKRPLLSDLRESGCLSGSSHLYLPQLKKSISLKSLIRKKVSRVLGKSSSGNFTSYTDIKKVFSTGYKRLYLLSLLGKYKLKLTSNHKLLTTKGWIPIKRLQVSSLVAIFDRFNFSKLQSNSNDSLLISKNISFNCIVDIKLLRRCKVYDAWGPSLGNFVSNDIFVHNSIEQDADVVLMLYRENYYSPTEQENNTTEVIIAKQRNGPIGTISLIFDPKLVSFSNFVILD